MDTRVTVLARIGERVAARDTGLWEAPDGLACTTVR
jgi:hypothetical protein